MALDRYLLPEQIEHENPQLPLFDDTVQKGGFRVCADVAARNAIPSAKRQIGTIVSINGELRQYKGTDVLELNWINQYNWQLIGTLATQVENESTVFGAILSINSIVHDMSNGNLWQLLEESLLTDSLSSIDKRRLNDSFEQINLPNNTIIRYNENLDVVEIEYANGQIQQISREDTYLVYLPAEADPIPNGTPLYFGDVGGLGVQTMIPYVASNLNIATALVKCVATIDLIPGNYGVAIRRGRLTLEEHGFTVGGRLWLADGEFTQTPPTSPDLNVECGIVLDSDTIQIYPVILSPIANTTSFSSSSLFMTDTDSDIVGYKVLGDLEESETTKTITAKGTTSPVEGEKYLSEPLGITSLPAGVIEMAGVVKVDSSVGTTTLTVSISLYHEDESTTPIADDISPDINNITDESIRFSVSFTAISSIEPTDRLLVETMLNVSTATRKTFTYYTGDGKGAYITIPLPLSHTDLVKLNDDTNFQHLTSEQVSLVDNSVQKVTSTDNAIVRFDGSTGAIQDSGAYIDDNGNLGLGTQTPSEKLDVIGNIAVSGTVDGRDVATDGAKLDGIEEFAQANVNADWNSVSGDSEILNKPTDITDLSTHASSELSDGSNIVKNAGTSTDNAIARFDGTTGKLLKESSVIVDGDNMRPQLVTFKTPSELTGTNAMDFNINQNWIVNLSGATTIITMTPITSSAVFTCNIEVVQDATGGRDLVLVDVDGKAVVNTQKFDFTRGGANERCFITIKYWLTGYRYLVDKYI